MPINLTKVANKISGIINDYRNGISDQDETEQALRNFFLDVVEQKIDGVEKEAKSFALWLKNEDCGSRTIDQLWKDYQAVFADKVEV